MIQQQLSQISGVGQITLGGAALPAVRIELEPDKLSSYGIGMEDVRAAVSAANADSAKGDIDQGGQRFEVTSNDQATTAADYRDLVIAYRNGAAVLLRDVAEVDDSSENIRNIGLYNGEAGGGCHRLSRYRAPTSSRPMPRSASSCPRSRRRCRTACVSTSPWTARNRSMPR